ncbi:MAG: hypothetical protein IKG37_06250 [Solobacterium sp.]|nr:hypothetical protein [Solobacterium sp.]
MKHHKTIFRIAVLTLSAVMFAACGKTEFKVIDNTEKKMVVAAENADKNSMIMTGSLEVREGEQVTVTSELTKGEVCVELYLEAEDQSIEELPELDGEPILKANLKPGEAASAEMQAGSYMVKATCLGKTSGMIVIEVKSGS